MKAVTDALSTNIGIYLVLAVLIVVGAVAVYQGVNAEKTDLKRRQ